MIPSASVARKLKRTTKDFLKAMQTKDYETVLQLITPKAVQILATLPYILPVYRDGKMDRLFDIPFKLTKSDALTLAFHQDTEGVRTALFDGLSEKLSATGWYEYSDEATLAFTEGSVAMLIADTPNLPIIMPLLKQEDRTYSVDFIGYLLFSMVLRASMLYEIGMRAVELDRIDRALEYFELIVSLERGYSRLRDLLWNHDIAKILVTDPRKVELAAEYRYITLAKTKIRELSSQTVVVSSPSRLYVEGIDNFEKVKEVNPAVVGGFLKNGRLDISEDSIKQALEEILNVPTHGTDWGGESNDLYTSNLLIEGERRTGAFFLKGPAVKAVTLQIRDCGKNGDQLVRLFESPAQVFVVQFIGRVSENVIKDVEGKVNEARARGKQAWFCIIDGQDTARLLHAYGKL